MPNTDNAAFAARIRERYPEGLTGIIAVGGTRTTYILEENRHKPDPGRIDDFAAYAKHLINRYLDLATSFMALGGQYLVMPVLAYQRFYEKGEKYAAYMAQLCMRLTEAEFLDYYQQHEVDPYFAGVDTLLHLPEDTPGYELGARLTAFQQAWPHQEHRRKIIWEIAPIPLFSVWQACLSMTDAEKDSIQSQLAATAASDLEAINQVLYRRFARAAYGTDLPMPHFYLGSNRKGDLKLRSMLPFALYSGHALRLFYTPYPSLFTTRETLARIIEEVAFGSAEFTTNPDYTGQYTTEQAEAAYQRIMDLSADPENVLGLTRVYSSE